MGYRLGILVTHPIQYYAPWFRYLAKQLDIQVFYSYRQDAKGQAEAGFGVEFDWDIPLLDGYRYRWLTNVARRPSLRSFNGCDTPEVYDLIQSGRFDAFLVFGWNRKSAIQTVRACWQNDVPVLMRGDSHLLTKRSWAKSTLKYLPYHWFLPRLAAHLYVGQRNKAYLQYYGVREERLFFAPHFVDSAYFARRAQEAERAGTPVELRSERGIPGDAFVFICVGKMIPKKRPADFVQACLKAFGSPEGSAMHALFVGDGALRESLQALARPYAKRIHFAGFCNQSQLPAFYKASNALAVPSDGRETWGLVVNEAASCGIPAVVSDAAGCAPDMIDEGRTGYTYPVGDVESLARRMLELKFACEHEPMAIRQRLAEKVACYSMERATEGLGRALAAVGQFPAGCK
jgi:glycosyltransferase involved in cell wall biosynthesis